MKPKDKYRMKKKIAAGIALVIYSRLRYDKGDY